jgi:hypothetical protein
MPVLRWRRVKIGTKSILYGAHCFLLHPWFVAAAWTKLYGFPWDPRLWFAFFLHDIGYIGKPNMDGTEGESHPELGAKIMGALFGSKWHDFALYHSRYYAKHHNMPYSRLCVADKLAIALTPIWLYLPMARATGEIYEYTAHAQYRVQGNEALTDLERSLLTFGSDKLWFLGVQKYMRRWVDEHRDGKVDTWTSSQGKRATLNADGIWR